MKRADFYKEYYRVTDRIFADKLCMTGEDDKKAWQKGQVNTSKSERKFFIYWQYGVFVAAFVQLLFFKNIFMLVSGLVLSVLSALITNFSIAKIEWLYLICNRDSVYGGILHKIFTEDFGDDQLSRRLKKQCRGLFKYGFGRYRDVDGRVKIVFGSAKVTVVKDGKKHILKKKYSSEEELISDIVDTVCHITEQG